MSIYVTEHYGVAGAFREPYTKTAPLASYTLSSASTAPFPSANCTYVRVSADAGSFLNLISTSTGIGLGSSNSFRIPANVNPECFAVSTLARLQCQST